MKLQPTKRVIAGILSFAIILSCLVLAGCTQRDSAKVLSGWVYAGDPVSGAAVSVYDASGKQIFKNQSITTNEKGAILLDAGQTLPAEFRIVAEGGTQYGDSFTAKLVADVRNYNAEEDMIYVNLATTFVAAYLDKNTDKSFDEASADVKKFLKLPDYVSLASGAQLTSQSFNIGQFISEANEKGGVNPFIDALLTELEAGKEHPFRNELPMQSIGSELAMEFAKGAASYLGGEAMGWGLELVGLDLDENHTEEELKKIEQGIDEMQSEISEMNTKLDALSAQMSGIKKQLDAMLKKIIHQQKFSEYNGRIDALNQLLSNISSLQSKINRFIQSPPSEGARENRKNEIKTLIMNQILGNEDVIHNALVGMGGTTPLITLWREIVYENRFLDSEDYAVVKAQYDFFRQYQDALLMIQVEYYHATEDTPGDNAAEITALTDKYIEQISAQEALLSDPIEENMVIDTDWDLMFYAENTAFTEAMLYDNIADSYPKINPDEAQKIMRELAQANPGDYYSKENPEKTDWKPLDYDAIGGPMQGHTSSKYKEKAVPWFFSDFLVQNGWPGEEVKAPVWIPFSGYESIKAQAYSYLMSDGAHFDKIFEFKSSDVLEDVPYMLLIYRWTSAKEIGYEHYKTDA